MGSRGKKSVKGESHLPKGRSEEVGDISPTSSGQSSQDWGCHEEQCTQKGFYAGMDPLHVGKTKQKEASVCSNGVEETKQNHKKGAEAA